MASRQEYPRPQFYRESWISLNGIWDFSYDDENKGVKEQWFHSPGALARKIEVPFTYQTQKSGIEETDFHDVVWYQKEIEVPAGWEDKQKLLHFGAVDYRAWVWVNGHYAGFHEGGHIPFHFNITDYLKEKNNFITVRAEDPTHDLTQPRGKQYWKEKSAGIFYTRTTGIWQTVWLEAVAETHLKKISYTPDVDRDEVAVHIQAAHVQPGDEVQIHIQFEGETVVEDTVRLSGADVHRKIKLNDFNVHDAGRLWSPESPNLYDAVITLQRSGEEIDRITSYFGMRKVSVENGIVMLNNEPYYMKLVLDQGYFPESLLTPPSEEAILKDIELTKEMGFNGVRKHQKVEDPRFLYWADRKGLLVWGEMANAYMYSADAVRRMTAEWQEVMDRDYSHPSIVAWMPINESWGVPNLLSEEKHRQHTLAMYHLTKSLDDTRLVFSNDGWEHTISDILTIHDYEASKDILLHRYSSLENILKSLPGNKQLYAPGYAYRREPIQVTEFGGIAYQKSDWEGWGYSGATTDEEFTDRYEAVISAMLASPLVQGFCYTQLTDVEQEINGLLTYDRKPKIPLETIRAINEGGKQTRFETEEEKV